MQYFDAVYGDQQITSPVLKDLIASPSVQRLKGISQQGLPERFYFMPVYSRYEHCVGVMLLLARLGASEEEQIAGLLHDVSHTAFSHAIDWVVGNHEKDDFQDNNHVAFLQRSELPGILETYGYSVEAIAEYERFPLLEREAPELCADRVDYTLRELALFEPVTLQDSFTNHEDTIVMTHQTDAKIFALKYLERQQQNWGAFESMSRYLILGHALRRAFDLGVLQKDDIWKDDETLIGAMLRCGDQEITTCFDLLSKKSLADLPKQPQTTKKKFRFIDPLFLKNDQPVRLSDVDAEFAETMRIAKEQNAEGTQLVDLDVAITLLKR